MSEFGLFDVKALKIGSEMLIVNLLNHAECRVRDALASKSLQKGQCCFLRVLPFEDYFILTGIGYPFPVSLSSTVRVISKSIREKHKKIFLTPFQICEIFFSVAKHEQLPSKERLELILREQGLTAQETQNAMERIKKDALGKGDFMTTQKKLIAGLRPQPNFDLKEYLDAFMETWNGHVAEQPGYVAKGPMETMLMRASLDYVQNRVRVNSKNQAQVQVKIDGLQKEWLDTPLEELDGKSPTQIILEERKQLGNPQKEISFEMKVREIIPGEEFEKKVNARIQVARNLLKDRRAKEAAKMFEDILAELPQIYPVWQNLGLAYVFLQDRVNAQRCFEKALELKPDYAMAREDLNRLKTSTDADLERVARDSEILVTKPNKKKR